MKFKILFLIFSAATAAQSTSTPEPGYEICRGIKVDDPCQEEDCNQCGYCWDHHSFYFRCHRTVPSDPKHNVTGVIVHEACDTNLWWNPKLKPEGVAVGGACDFWVNLDQAVRDGYTNDPNCVTPVVLCEYGQDDGLRCSENYWYYNPAKMTDREDLTCPSDLLWDPSTETCRECEHVRYSNGNNCPCK